MRRESPTPTPGVGRGPGAPEAQGGLEPLGERQQPEDHPDPRQELGEGDPPGQGDGGQEEAEPGREARPVVPAADGPQQGQAGGSGVGDADRPEDERAERLGHQGIPDARRTHQLRPAIGGGDVSDFLGGRRRDFWGRSFLVFENGAVDLNEVAVVHFTAGRDVHVTLKGRAEIFVFRPIEAEGHPPQDVEPD